MIDRKKFYDGVRKGPFPGKLTAGQVNGCGAILDEWERRKLKDIRWLAYMMGTVFWECDQTMQPITEKGGLRYLVKKKYYPWFGRGYVQLTWKANYEKMSGGLKDAGFKDWNLIATPDLALRPDIAAFIMFEGMIRGAFTGKKLSDYFNDKKTDWINARRIINGTDRATEIADISKHFYTDISLAA